MPSDGSRLSVSGSAESGRTSQREVVSPGMAPEPVGLSVPWRVSQVSPKGGISRSLTRGSIVIILISCLGVRSRKAQREGVSRHVYRSASVESWELPHQRPQLRLRQADGQLGGFRPERHEVQKHRAGAEPGASGELDDPLRLCRPRLDPRASCRPAHALPLRPPAARSQGRELRRHKRKRAIRRGLVERRRRFSRCCRPADTRLLADFNVVEWLLGNFATVEEVRAALTGSPPIVIWGQVDFFGRSWKPLPFHYAVHDAAGNDLVIEITEKRLTFPEPVASVLANEPRLPWHRQNLSNYANLSFADPPAERLS